MQIIDTVFTEFGIRVQIKINNRKILTGIAEVIGEKEIITITQPSPEEIEDYQADKIEKERVTQLVKKLNQEQKKHSKTKKEENKRKPVRFPGT